MLNMISQYLHARALRGVERRAAQMQAEHEAERSRVDPYAKAHFEFISAACRELRKRRKDPLIHVRPDALDGLFRLLYHTDVFMLISTDPEGVRLFGNRVIQEDFDHMGDRLIYITS